MRTMTTSNSRGNLLSLLPKFSVPVSLLLLLVLVILLTTFHSSAPPITPIPPPQQTHPTPMTPASKPDPNAIRYRFLFFNVLNSGQIQLFYGPPRIVPPGVDPTTGVETKDTHISAAVSARLFLPKLPSPAAKLPVILFIHGGAFLFQSAMSAEYTTFVTDLAAATSAVVVSVEYRLYPKVDLATCYYDAWDAFKWLISAAANTTSSAAAADWLTKNGDFSRVFLIGDSAGGNLCHYIAARSGREGVPGVAGGPRVNLSGMVLIHPYFATDDKMWLYMCKKNDGPEDRRMKPLREDLKALVVPRVLVIVAEKDKLKPEGVKYVNELKTSGWQGSGVELVENKNKDHCWFTDVKNREDPENLRNLQKINDFVNHQ